MNFLPAARPPLMPKLTIEPAPRVEPAVDPDRELPDLADLRGHPVLRRCLEIAAAGACPKEPELRELGIAHGSRPA